MLIRLILELLALSAAAGTQIADAVREIHNDERTPTTADDLAVGAAALAKVVSETASAMKAVQEQP